ncbi:MAG: hypothetical protein FJY83_10490, partial [Candidatus Aminicenantes bacterium]|nr:hypothetical protein [Candidatus Aminicenantes bacterium]
MVLSIQRGGDNMPSLDGRRRPLGPGSCRKNARGVILSAVTAALLCLFGVESWGGDASAPAAARPWTPDDILLAERASQWAVSPDGKWAVWIKTKMDKEKNGLVSDLFLTDLSAGRARQLTRSLEKCAAPAWSPDGRSIAFLAERPPVKPEESDEEKSRAKSLKQKDKEDEGPQLWLLALSGGEPFPLTKSARDIGSFQWADDDTIVFSAKEGKSLYEKELEKRKDKTLVVDDAAHEPPVRLFKLNVQDRKSARLTDNADFISLWRVSPDGRRAVSVHRQSLSYDWDQKTPPRSFLADLSTGEKRELFAGERLVPSAVRWAADGSGFYVAAPYSTHPQYFQAYVTLLYFYDLKTSSLVRVELGGANGLEGGPEVTPDGFLALLPEGVRLVPARFVKSGLSWKRSDLAGDHVRNIFDIALDRSGRTAVYSHSTASRPEQWFRSRLEGARLTGAVRVTDLNPSYQDRTAARTEIVRWKGALDDEVEGLLYFPHGFEAGRRYPLLVAPHGGPLAADLDRWEEDYAYPQQLLCRR